jgi:hypothetical protein
MLIGQVAARLKRDATPADSDGAIRIVGADPRTIRRIDGHAKIQAGSAPEATLRPRLQVEKPPQDPLDRRQF